MNKYKFILRNPKTIHNIMNLEKTLAEIQEPEFKDIIAPFWEQAVSTFPGAENIPFLDPAQFKAAREFASFPADIDAELEETAEIVKKNLSLSLAAWYIDWRCFECTDRTARKWPEMRNALGDKAGVFWLLLALALIPRLRKYHKSLGVPEEITRETALEPYCFSLNYKMANAGRTGIFHKQYFWFRNYLADNLYFRIGRFEYWLKPFKFDITVFRHVKTGQVKALADPGNMVTPEGFIDSLSDSPQPWTEWPTSFHMDAKIAEGYPVSPLGIIEKEKIKLSLEEWSVVLKKDDTILEMHIPAGGKMDYEKCGESMRCAAEFFQSRFPEKKPLAITTSSWMFSPLLEEILPAESNLVKYMRELYLCPVKSGGTSSLWFLFFQDKPDPATAPRDTSLQRAILEYLEPGRVWHNGGMFVLINDLDKYGTQYYRNQ